MVVWDATRGVFIENKYLLAYNFCFLFPVRCLDSNSAWVQYFTADGIPYWHNKTTGATEWKLPDSFVPRHQESGIAPVDPVHHAEKGAIDIQRGSHLPPGWQQLYTQSGIPYYHREL